MLELRATSSDEYGKTPLEYAIELGIYYNMIR